ncbi:POTRA domain-containing protein [Dialister invisus]|uniref:POTRA domain-containing protein n=1 Tax=Dialister invisus TaxID=218538 RepID=UPI0028E2CEB7|nr:POTRA domain-containing protein [Dialister invisus]
MEIRKSFEILLWENDHAGENRNSLYFLTMMTGAVSAAPVLNYTGEERLEEARQERLCMPRVENIGSSLNEKEETQGAALEPVFRIDEIILSGQGEKFGRLHKIIYGKDSALIPWKTAFSIKEGNILNIRRLEQGLEQMKRVSSSDVSMKLLPADNI